MRKFGLIGNPLTHSFSEAYFNKKFKEEGISDVQYKAYELKELDEFSSLFEGGVLGLNVTIPFKETIISYLDGLDPIASQIKAVNTIKKVGERLIGFNTDVYGFRKSLERHLDFLSLKNALILGTGGSSKAVAYVLKQLSINYNHVSRSGKGIDYSDLKSWDMELYDLIINTTPLGMYPNMESFPLIPFDGINEKHLVFDLIYNPEKSLFLTKAEQQSARIQNGLDMLIFQAEKSWKIWNTNLEF